MHAILIAEENRDTILGSCPTIASDDVDAWLQDAENGALYFIPKYTEEDSQTLGWAIYPQRFIADFYNYDAEHIKTELTEIFRKEA
jgi:hypothetical protein